jgi:Fe-S-cluster-containing hydrogenase component 2
MKKQLTRREFLKDAGLALGGAVSGIAGVDVVFSAQNNTRIRVPRASGHIVQTAQEESACSGCGTCELVCAAVHGSFVGPSERRIWLAREGASLTYGVLPCLQCDYPACYYACPLKNESLCIDNKTHARYIDAKKCPPDCRKCIKACVLDPPRINFNAERNTALMCDLCKDRVNGPACIEICPARCLKITEPVS